MFFENEGVVMDLGALGTFLDSVNKTFLKNKMVLEDGEGKDIVVDIKGTQLWGSGVNFKVEGSGIKSVSFQFTLCQSFLDRSIPFYRIEPKAGEVYHLTLREVRII